VEFIKVLVNAFQLNLMDATEDRIIWLEVIPRTEDRSSNSDSNSENSRSPQRQNPTTTRDVTPRIENIETACTAIAGYYNHDNKTLRLFNTREGELTILNTTKQHLEKRLNKQPENKVMTQILKSKRVHDASDLQHYQQISQGLADILFDLLPGNSLEHKRFEWVELLFYKPGKVTQVSKTPPRGAGSGKGFYEDTDEASRSPQTHDSDDEIEVGSPLVKKGKEGKSKAISTSQKHKLSSDSETDSDSEQKNKKRMKKK
jgi:hypothetical protein